MTREKLLKIVWFDGRNLRWLKNNRLVGALNKFGYRISNIEGKTYKEHRLIWLFSYGHLPTREIDHINGVKDDNCLGNLRVCSHEENTLNRKVLSKKNKTGFTGVCLHKKSGKYQARLKNYHLGVFNTIQEAAACASSARNRAGIP